MKTALKAAGRLLKAAVAMYLGLRLVQVIQRLSAQHKAMLEIEQARESEKELAAFHQRYWHSRSTKKPGGDGGYGTFDYLGIIEPDGFDHLKGYAGESWVKKKDRE
jgi:hypothetical protein